MTNATPDVVVAALYRFAALPDFVALKDPLYQLMIEHEVRGTLLLAREGINGTIAGSRQGIDRILDWLKSDPRFADLEAKESYVDTPPFYRTKVKLKKEVVTMGVEGIDPKDIVGTYVEPADWNALIADPEVLVLDTRNKYEVDIGSFENAINPETDSFRELPAYVEKHLDPVKHKKVAMFCTGGIRCEKSTAFLKRQGFNEVYHLKGWHPEISGGGYRKRRANGAVSASCLTTASRSITNWRRASTISAMPAGDRLPKMTSRVLTTRRVSAATTAIRVTRCSKGSAIKSASAKSSSPSAGVKRIWVTPWRKPLPRKRASSRKQRTCNAKLIKNSELGSAALGFSPRFNPQTKNPHAYARGLFVWWS